MTLKIEIDVVDITVLLIAGWIGYQFFEVVGAFLAMSTITSIFLLVEYFVHAPRRKVEKVEEEAFDDA